MGDHRRKYRLIIGLFLLSAMAGVFLIGEVLDVDSPPEGETKAFSEVDAFFKGSDQEVEVYRLIGREAGPTVLIFAGIHGDESGGYLAADRYVGLKLLRGNLIVVPRLNLYAVLTGRRTGLSGRDMNRKFSDSEEENDPDDKVVRLAKSLMDQADIILNLHQGYGFYSPVWVDQTRNPVRWGQCNVIDISTFNLPDGERLHLENFAREVVQRINSKLIDKRYHFHVNNTNTFSERSFHKEQRRSLTYYALAHKHKMAFGIEATKNCSLAQGVGYLSLAVNAVLEKAGIRAEAFPSILTAEIAKELKRNEEFSGLRVRINGVERVIPRESPILLNPGDRLQILSIEANHPRGWYPSLSGSEMYNGMGKVFSIRQNDRLILQKYGKRVAVFHVVVKKDTALPIEGRS
ncbi:MAG: succinylglutamate desuccinylase/aspartoacylase family protein [Syntrophaceae bacterium]|nr:succinylglutamate desuccinylase/aspartoacylase family protein [Syntrophaceae bacterium]